ncbi:hypothetical protein [Kocuria dechangensis]|uniref:hypothetical protein n=1 Tax=Kocuria dechangensis TaxID=1176249 RepID=UPI001665EF52|nr:hypothetical protein [Kocuria dechangensis]
MPNTIRGLLVVVAAGFLVLGVRDVVLRGWFGRPMIVGGVPMLMGVYRDLRDEGGGRR